MLADLKSGHVRHAYDQQKFWIATQFLKLFHDVVWRVYKPILKRYPRISQHRLYNCKEMMEYKEFSKNQRVHFVIAAMDKHGAGEYPTTGGFAARLRWLPQTAVVTITQDVAHELLLDLWRKPGHGKYDIRKMRWFLWSVWQEHGKHECLDLADEIEEELAEAMSKHFHIALTVAKVSSQ